jgi:hypothetical protein
MFIYVNNNSRRGMGVPAFTGILFFPVTPFTAAGAHRSALACPGRPLGELESTDETGDER